MKVLMIAPTPFFSDRGCHIRIYEEIKTLKQLGHSITLCTYHLGEDIPGLTIKRSLTVPWYNKLDAGPSWHKPYLDMLLFFLVLKELYTNKFDLIHAHLHEGIFIGKIAAFFRFKKIPLIFDSQGGLVSELSAQHFITEGSWLMKFFSWMEKKLYRAPDILITSSNYLKGYPNHVVFDTVNQDSYKVDQSDVQKIVEQYNLKNKLVITYSGGIKSYKGINIIFDAIPLVLKKIPNAIFLMIGYGELAEYQQVVKRLNVEKNVIFTGRVSYFDIPKYLHVSDIAIDPKPEATEANGKVLHYRAAGLPTIVYNRSNVSVLADDYIYLVNDNQELAKQIVFLAEHPEMIKASKAHPTSGGLDTKWIDSFRDIYGQIKLA